jgi:hypothetical protein
MSILPAGARHAGLTRSQCRRSGRRPGTVVATEAIAGDDDCRHLECGKARRRLAAGVRPRSGHAAGATGSREERQSAWDCWVGDRAEAAVCDRDVVATRGRTPGRIGRRVWDHPGGRLSTVRAPVSQTAQCGFCLQTLEGGSGVKCRSLGTRHSRSWATSKCARRRRLVLACRRGDRRQEVRSVGATPR